MLMTDISPSILASYPLEYNRQIERVAPFATRLHIDVADGIFTPNQTIDVTNIWWPGGIRADIHVMYKRPVEILDELIALQPQLIIVHAEAEGDFITLAKKLHYHGIEAGIALLPQTQPEYIRPGIELIDHVLIFSGDLGHFGGSADMSQLEKARIVRSMSSRAEIGWDGGVTDQNIRALAEGGIEVIVSGGYIQKARDAKKAYEQLHNILA
jgi:ribulose-phosphate 3-epimerase